MTANRNALIVIAACFLLALGLPWGGVVPQAAAQVTVTGATPSSAKAGTLGLSVTITGTGFKSGATAKFYLRGTKDTGGVNVLSTTYRKSTTLIAVVDVPATAVQGSYDIEVTSGTAAPATGQARFTVLPKGIDPCGPGSPVLTSSDYRDPSFAASAGLIATPKFAGIAGVAIDAQQRIVAVGSRYDSCAGTGTREWVVMRYTPDGVPDPSFGGTGMVTKSFTRYSASLSAVAIDPSDGSIVVGGVLSGKNLGLVARYKESGELDTTFAVDGIEPGVRSLSLERYMTSANAIAIQSDGKIVVAGGDGGVMAVFRLNVDGSFDTTGFNANAVYKPQLPGRYVYTLTPSNGAAVAIQEVDGEERIVVAGVAGVMKNGVGVKDAAVWRFTSAGVPDPAFGASGLVTTDFYGGYETFNAVAIDSSNRIVAAGYANKGPDYTYGDAGVVARYEQGGALDGSFNGGAADQPFVAVSGNSQTQSLSAMAIDPAGSIYVAGAAYYKDAGGATTLSGTALWRLLPDDGGPDPVFGLAGWVFDRLAVDALYGSWKALALQADGNAVVAGSFTWGAVYPAIARFRQ